MQSGDIGGGAGTQPLQGVEDQGQTAKICPYKELTS